jgi:hypothetical protein
MTTQHTEALKLASHGWHVVPMLTQTKHPGNILGTGWQHQASIEPAQINRWFAQNPSANVGVLLGPKSNLIDVEYDSDEGRSILEPLCGDIITPTYKSAKSIHRLFSYDEKYEPEKAAVGIRGTEWRFGQDKAQSVFPPSIHDTGVRYEWLPGLSPADCGVVCLPDELWMTFLKLKNEQEQTDSRLPENQVARRYIDGDSMLDRARKYVDANYNFEDLLRADNWVKVRNRGEAQDWRRPGKTKGSISATINFGNSGTLRVFTNGVNGLKQESSYDLFAYLCATRHGDSPGVAARELCPAGIVHEDKEKPFVDLRFILGENRPDDFDDEAFCDDSVPKYGLIRQIYDYYLNTSHRTSKVMGLATAVSLCQTIFGRRIASSTDLRTNDYNVIMAPTSSGKEACETTITRILFEADFAKFPMIPPDVQSGNGLLKSLHGLKAAIWVCDEFGKVLEAVLSDKGNTHVKQIGTHLLKLYGKSASIYGGAAHADGIRNQIIQPHLCLLGLTTGQIFETITSKEVRDGLFGRLAFWPVQLRPRRIAQRSVEVPADLVARVREWIQFEPTGFNPDHPDPKIIEMDADSEIRAESHSVAIDDRMESEPESRAAIWGRVSARAVKLALVSRCARLPCDPLAADWPRIRIEPQDMDWGIRMSNWLGRVACGLIKENVNDTQAQRAMSVILNAVQPTGEIERVKLMREYRSITSSEFTAAAKCLQDRKSIEIVTEKTGGRPKITYKLAE